MVGAARSIPRARRRIAALRRRRRAPRRRAVAALHAAAVSVWTIGEIFESPSRAAVTAAMAPAHARGRYQGAVVLAFGAAQLVAPPLSTWTLEHAHPGVLGPPASASASRSPSPTWRPPPRAAAGWRTPTPPVSPRRPSESA